jgi:molybdopterin converting factor small subunit
MNNNIFGSNYNNTTPTNFLNTSSVLDATLADSYAKLEALKRQQQQLQQAQTVQQNTVLTDIDAELKNLSEDEMTFLTSSKEYQTIANKYQAEFSQFLINKFSNEYMQVGNTRTLEELLYTIKKQKEKYKDKFATDINEIRDQNKDLITKNNELAESNQALQQQLEEIKKRLWKDN